MAITEQQRTQIAETLAGAGLDAALEPCLRRAVAAWEIVAVAPATPGSAVTGQDLTTFPLGATRFGGSPDLPAGTDWPKDDDGKLGNFFAQLDLADLARRAPGTGLPESGLLSLFAIYLESAAEPVVIAALLTPAGAPLERRAPPPAENDYADPDTGYLEPVAVDFVPAVSLPLSQREFRNELATVLDQDGIDDLHELFGRESENTIGQLGGFGNAYDGDDFRRILYFHRAGHPGAQWSDHFGSREEWADAVARYRANGTYEGSSLENRAAEFAWIFDNAEVIAAEAARWRQFLRIDSNHPMRLSINDWDPIYFYAPAAELAAGDVSHVEAMVTQG